MNLSLIEVARITSGAVLGDGGVTVAGASIDSRSTSQGQLFVALSGTSVDGHDYIDEAVRNGASGLLLEREVDTTAPRVIVSHAPDALAAIAKHTRDVIDPVVVGVTGSVGKTGTKDLIASVASRTFSTLASQRNFNNELGLPLTLTEIKPETEVVVCEMGARGLGQIAALCELARPQVGVVTNVGVSHFELFGSQENIAKAKGELISSLLEGHTAVLNADDPFVAAMGALTEANVLTYGLEQPAWLVAEAIRKDRLGRHTFRMSQGADAVWVTLGQSGKHQVYNALAAAAVGLALGVSLKDCAVGLEEASASDWRMQVSEHEGIVFVNDAYNASPSSTSAALLAAADMVMSGGRLVAVLGHMAELGPIAAQEHHRIGALAASLAQSLVVVGEEAKPIAQGASEAGLDDVIYVIDKAEVPGILNLRQGDVLLVKGSRSAELQDLVDEAKKTVGAR